MAMGAGFGPATRRWEMAAKECKNKCVEIYLTNWQMRMVKDLLGVECTSWTVPICDNKKIRYSVPLPGTVGDLPRLYFTDSQIRQIQDATGCLAHFTILDKSGWRKYRVPIEKFTDKMLEATRDAASPFMIQAAK